MASTIQLIFDCESLGTNDDSVILDCSVVAYDIVKDAKTPLADFLPRARRFKLDAKEQMAAGRITDPDTIAWWQKQDIAAQQAVAPASGDLSRQEFYEQFIEYTDEVGFDRKNGFVWQRGTIDGQWLDTIWAGLGVKQFDRPFMWWKIRDIRTAVDLSGASSKLNGYADEFWPTLTRDWPEFQKHNSVHDTVSEILSLRLAGVYPDGSD